MKIKTAQKGIIISVISILAITILEFPAPIGLETRPQDKVAIGWLFFFAVILVTEIATIPFVLRKPMTGTRLGITAGGLNILQAAADQLRLMQPENATLVYTVIEYSIAFISLGLIYFSFNLAKSLRNEQQ